MTAVDPEQQSYSTIEDLDSWISNGQEWQQEHLAAWIFGVFGGLALALAAVGLYSVVSYTVAQRTNEFGIRMALGAERGHVLRIVFASTLGSVGSGIVVGLALTLGLNTVLAQWARGNSRDPVILLAGALLLSLRVGDRLRHTGVARVQSGSDDGAALRIDLAETLPTARWAQNGQDRPRLGSFYLLRDDRSFRLQCIEFVFQVSSCCQI